MRRPRLKGKTQTTLILHNYVLAAVDRAAVAARPAQTQAQSGEGER